MTGLVVSRTSFPAGGGAYSLPTTTIGIFLNDQPQHRFSHAASRSELVPLAKHQGWILPGGSDGLCEYDKSLDVVVVSLEDSILAELGMNAAEDFQPVVGDIDPILLQLCLGADDFGSGGILYRETMHRAVAAQLVQVVRPGPDWNRDIEDARLRRVLDYIHDDLAADLTLSAMADLAAMSPAHFSKAFKSATGRSPLQYVIAARLDRASLLLKTGSLTVAEIAFRVGYKDLSRFGQHFKRRFGKTPAAHREA